MDSPRSRRGESTTILEAIQANRKRLLALLGVVFFIAYIASAAPAQQSHLPLRQWIPSPFLTAKKATPIVHPIPKLMSDAQTKYKNLLDSQSKSLAQAVREYKTRYGRAPPKGFDDWWEFVKENGGRIVDEYDQLVSDLEPFWEIGGEEVRRRAFQVGQLPSVDLVRLTNGVSATLKIEKEYEDTEVSARAKGFRVMIEKFQKKLPDMDFPINAKAEGRILIPWEHQHYPNLTVQDSSGGVESMIGPTFTPDWKGDSNVWEQFRRTCPPSSQARRLFHSVRARLKEGQRAVNHLERVREEAGKREGVDRVGIGEIDGDFSFVEGVDDRFDFCSYPHQHLNQGHFFSDWRTIPVLYPIFSPAKGPGYSDILIPSHYYYSSTQRYTYGWDPSTQTIKDVDDHEVPWEEKSDLIFWRGATTGGGSSPPGFVSSYQRHRFLRMSSDTSAATRNVVFANPPNTTSFTSSKFPISQLNSQMMDAAFTRAISCTQYPGGCLELQKDHRFAEAVPLGEHWKHKYLIDFDGMGYSARLFAFLASDSAVVKSTVYTEFFSDWIQPWLHYVPLSQNYQEIYNIHAYFSGPASFMTAAVNQTTTVVAKKNLKALDGDKQLHRIARAGRQWKATVGRKVDMEIYVYRLCLEWARLWSDDREAMSYKG